MDNLHNEKEMQEESQNDCKEITLLLEKGFVSLKK